MKTISLCTIALSLCLTAARAEVRMPAIFGDGMVLQREDSAALWGRAEPGKSVTVFTSWNGKRYRTRTGSDGRWRLRVETGPAGCGHTVTVTEGNTLRFDDVALGEVWLCSGQSNMEMPVKGFVGQPVEGAAEAISTSTDPGLRLFSVAQHCSPSPCEGLDGRWSEASPASVAEFSATAYFFGRMLRRALGVPVGLVKSSWNGTSIERWMSRESLETAFAGEVPLPDTTQAELFRHAANTGLYNGMIAPLAGYGIRGVIWYQGESNRHDPTLYGRLFPVLVETWRRAWDIGPFPFYYVQIAPYEYRDPGHNSALFREVQTLLQERVPGTAMVALTDLGEAECIHPSRKREVGERLARLALTRDYGQQGYESEAPLCRSLEIRGDRVELHFSHAPLGLCAQGPLEGLFEVAGADRVFHPAHARISGNKVIVRSDRVEHPEAVRYCFRDFCTGTLYNTFGHPVPSFRTDDWPLLPPPPGPERK
ncbi:sialate O-acetylesterase [Gallalistipes aquisgranensis]|uniref:sialate O-acetylesterase n=1 Tax=Gallalistipes aquisgranensis TaxID=2779358 RepID=UPI001CF8B1D8|nr:sialate O-acetylesterase [Gallalistipes aquisgranensis]MBE5034053.1 sialate O-acetylesterase [Gallalistipes aquisgranensis]